MVEWREAGGGGGGGWDRASLTQAGTAGLRVGPGMEWSQTLGGRFQGRAN